MTVAIAAITLTFAVGSFQSIVVTNRIAADANDLVAAISLARSEAVKRSGVAGVVAVGGDWSSGFDVMIDTDTPSDGAVDEVVRSWRAAGAENVLSNADGLTTVLMDARGGVGTKTTFTLEPTGDGCPSGQDRKREIEISISGHVSISKKSCD